ncbi:carboxyvinyl-carboxyphosphonate phosphorylmutase [Planotetraspora thailandica]|uniref:Carboxyvinyl-carboxyphosphonate phosphorylmutase n=1 Tax=Planotetraspora thailandica TaxID=487172 RepID=A0A8J3Y2L2_9ACTN|nr:isocitrate lyase/PEP mutase family protein [Planotetraspora thailandica]GII59753.1 carboxyvinyl-carboxyphosphonate phosphorylmutase [Planotetraspora thailandica]
MKRTTRLRASLDAPEILVAPGAYDGTGARLVQALGFEAIYMSGFETSAGLLGEPDVGYLTMTQMATRVSTICDIVDLPLIADGDTGYGNPLNVRRTVKAYEKAGAAGMHIEDQTFPKCCGHLLGRHVIPTGEMVEKVKAAVDARDDPAFVIIARTDARTTMGLDEAIDRGAAYHEAGADMLFIESPESEDEMRRVCVAFRGVVPVLINQIEGGRTPTPGVRALQEMGYALALFSVGTALAAAKGMRRYLEALAAEGDTSGVLDDVILFEDFTQLIGLGAHVELEKRYEGHLDDGAQPRPRRR